MAVPSKGNQNILFSLFLLFPFSLSLFSLLYALASPASYNSPIVTIELDYANHAFVCLLLENPLPRKMAFLPSVCFSFGKSVYFFLHYQTPTKKPPFKSAHHRVKTANSSPKK
uniref:Uncharacterized protein n=1 Tax=Anopheles darlingi TaxID=43151 RepID=A0A2M4DHE6_ANODA